MLKEIYNYRQMIVSMVRKDLRGRYKGSVLGFLWTFINPLLQLLVYYNVFKIIMKVNIDKFYLYLFVALIPWIFFSACITGGAVSVIGQKDLIKKVYFPREVIPISYVSSCFVNMLLSFIVVIAVSLFAGVRPTLPGLLALPIVMVIEYMMGLGIALVVSSITVYLRDLEHILGIVTMLWMYATPICYPIDYIPERFLPLYNLNPITPVITAYRSILYDGTAPDMSSLLVSCAFGAVFLVLGVIIFRKLKRNFAEEL